MVKFIKRLFKKRPYFYHVACTRIVDNSVTLYGVTYRANSPVNTVEAYRTMFNDILSCMVGATANQMSINSIFYIGRK